MAPCKKCGGETEGYKCDIDDCGAESVSHDPKHGLDATGKPLADHPRGAAHCMPKCANCGEAEEKCDPNVCKP